jgi:uncharacterized protein
MLACRTRNKRLVELLLEWGADVNASNESKQTALMWIVDSGDKKITELLLTRSININATDEEGRAALWYASHPGRPEIIALLKEHGAE